MFFSQKKRKKLKRKNGNDPFEDDDEDDQEKMREMARKFNMKYVSIGIKKYFFFSKKNKIVIINFCIFQGQVGKKKSKNEDYVDLGAGYDESDSFIDNTQAVSTITHQNNKILHF